MLPFLLTAVYVAICLGGPLALGWFMTRRRRTTLTAAAPDSPTTIKVNAPSPDGNYLLDPRPRVPHSQRVIE
jgi:hypothetical protein